MKRMFTNKLFKGAAEDYPDHKYGLKTFYEPSNAVFDIVFIHGITGHRENTWSVGNGARPWPETFLPTKIPDARIISFGYDASVIGWRSGISSNNITDHAKNLLTALGALRDADSSVMNPSERPIVFVAHSLGGLVCEDALLSSRTNVEIHLQRILKYTWGILFLGTPHFGSSLAPVARRFATLIKPTTRTNLQVLKVLSRDSEVLARIQNDFHSLLRSRTREGHQPIEIICFYEEVPFSGIGEIVPKRSATLPGYAAIGIHSNHRNMARFATDCDPGFVSVACELQRWAKEIRCLQGGAGTAGAVEISDRKENPCLTRSATELGGITVWGNVIKSNVVAGDQTIYNGLTFTD
ncbi:hypothetical protein EG329_001453 [Mollisiaceae sp. DMI_Dod_QoI]|nr:hypothetical protein EG329_001453 [Helotiales sp. DMI_Dod_QoI]